MTLRVALAGNPNCGKTTIFNALTGAQQKVANWPGVTVDCKIGHFKYQSTSVEVIDLPGTYSLITASSENAIDERIACEFILNRKADIFINIIDASNLERNLYLTAQLLEMRVPVIIALNMMDIARKRGIQIDLKKLSATLGCPVLSLEAHQRKGIKELKQLLLSMQQEPSLKKIPYPSLLEKSITTLAKKLQDSPTILQSEVQHDWVAMRLLEEDVFVQSLVDDTLKHDVMTLQQEIKNSLQEDADILLADARYRFIHTLVTEVVTQTQPQKTWTARLDDVVLNRWLGIPIFLGVMYALFFFSINVGGAFQDFFDISSDTLFVDGFAHLLGWIGAPNWLVALLANGLGKGINTTITFIPVIGAMFLALAFLEDSGYMARAAFVVDKMMRVLGLPGKSFVPMIVGFGCNVPAVMATRTLENKRDRLLTVMMSPFMSCGARLAIYAIFTAAFFSQGGQNIVFMLYMVGIVMAMLTGLLLRKTVLRGDPAPLVMELPPYHLPSLRTLMLHAWQRLKIFVLRAGKLIVPICILLGLLNSLNIDGTLNGGEGDAHSLLSTIGQWLTPIFAPMGIHQDNWPATVGLATGILAKEVVVGTLNTLYSQIGHLASMPDEVFSVWAGLSKAVASVGTNVSQLIGSLSNPVLAKAPLHTVTDGVYGVMSQRFDGKIGAVAYLLFVLLYFPCISTTAAMLREVSRAWTWFSVIWTTLIAYAVAVLFYQSATFMQHPLGSLLWIGGLLGALSVTIFLMRRFTSDTTPMRGRYEFVRD